jgi:DNA-binding GntR family transcriptional regulator
VRRAAVRFDDADAAKAREQLERMDELRASGDLRRTMRAHTDFHFALYEASHSALLVDLIRPLWDRSERFRPTLFTRGDELQARHRAADERLLAECVAQNPDGAAQALYDHLELASDVFRRELGGRGIFDR